MGECPEERSMADERWRNDLIARRRRLGLSVAELGRHLGVPPAAMEGLEDGCLLPTGDLRDYWEEALVTLAARLESAKRP
jgi:DNA-binding XRE family transcriptional regulator